MERGASLGTRIGNVRFGSKADISACVSDVRFTPKSGHSQRRLRCPLCAKSGHQSIRAEHAFEGEKVPRSDDRRRGQEFRGSAIDG